MHRASSVGAAAVFGSGAIRLDGGDALSLLHRVSTNALLDLEPGQARPTLFCDFRGRLLHRAVVYRARDGAVWLVRDDAPGAELAAFVDRHVFRDDVRIDDRSGTWAVGRSPQGTESEEEDGVPRRIVSGSECLELGTRAPVVDERARIRAARPRHGHEIVSEFNPFEVALGGEVHLDKGCYTGQEALMRLVTYHSVRRRLARVDGRSPSPAVPAPLVHDGEAVGQLTSATATSESEWIGLGVLRTEFLDSRMAPTLPGGVMTAIPIPVEAPRPMGRP